jgi:hypothetical protein
MIWIAYQEIRFSKINFVQKIVAGSTPTKQFEISL